MMRLRLQQNALDGEVAGPVIADDYRRDRDWGSPAGSPLVNGVDGGGTTGPMSPSGAWSRSMITGAWSLGPLPLRAWRSTQAALTRAATGPPARIRSILIPRSWW